MHSRHAASSLQALYQVFVFPALSKHARIPAALQKQCQPVATAISVQRREFSGSIPRPSKTRAPETRTQRWNNEITARMIYLVDSTTGNLEESPRTTYDVLNRIDIKTHRLVQLTPHDPLEPVQIPVCKVVSKKEVYEAEKRRKVAQKETKKASKLAGEDAMKTIELNWAIGGNDLGHRLDRVKEFLGEGRRVDVVLAAKKRGRKATLEECEGVLRRIEKLVEETPGAKVRGEGLEGKKGGVATLSLQGKPVVAGTPAKSEDDKKDDMKLEA